MERTEGEISIEGSRQSPTNLTIIITASISCACAIAVLVLEWWRPSKIHFINFVCWLSVTAIIVDLNYIVMYADAHSILQHPALCDFHGFWMMLAETAMYGWPFCIAAYVWWFHRGLLKIPPDTQMVQKTKEK